MKDLIGPIILLSFLFGFIANVDSCSRVPEERKSVQIAVWDKDNILQEVVSGKIYVRSFLDTYLVICPALKKEGTLRVSMHPDIILNGWGEPTPDDEKSENWIGYSLYEQEAK